MMLRLALIGIVLAAPCARAEEPRYLFMQGDRVEYQSNFDRTLWDLQGWYGVDLHKLWWKLEGADEPENDNELQLLYSRAISPYFDAQAGLRAESDDAGSETSLVLGVQGLAPYEFELDAAAFLTEDGDIEFRGEIERDVRFSQRIVLQPRLELNVSSAHGDDATLELRLRYEINRKLAPYIGASWQRHFSDTQTEENATSFVAGLRFMF